MLHSVSGIQHPPQLWLRDEKDFVREKILNFRARRKTAHVDESLIGGIGALNKARFTGNRSAVGIIAFCCFCGRRRGRRRRWRGRLHAYLSVFRWGVWIKRLLGGRIFDAGFGRKARRGTSRACGRYLVRGTSRDKTPGKQR